MPCVSILMTVGRPALADVIFGQYPPLALIAMICLPSSILTLFAAEKPVFSLPLFAEIIAAPMMIAVISMDTAVAFVFIESNKYFIKFRLKLKN